MAKDKTFEEKYKLEGRRRAYERLNNRTILWRQRGERGGGNLYNGKECSECGGQMRWCSTCDMWTRICCVEYGTCQCS